MPHVCPNPPCKAQVSDNMLACRKDWYRLPRSLRNRIWVAWAEGEGAGSPEHSGLVRQAIQWYQDNPEG